MKRNREGRRKAGLPEKLLCLLLTLIFAAGQLAIPTSVFAAESGSAAREHGNLVLFAIFADENEENWLNEDAGTAYGPYQGKTNGERIMDYYEGTQNRSFQNYMSNISGGAHIVKNTFPQYDARTGEITPVKLTVKESEAKTANWDEQIVTEIQKAVNLAGYEEQVDLNKDGTIDNISIILQGDDAAGSANATPSLRSHKFVRPNSGNWNGTALNGLVFNMLNTQSLNGKRAGLIAHEYMHSLGYPDLYRRDGTKDYPVGNWDMMSSDGRFMTYPLAYLRQAVSGWVTLPELTEDGTAKAAANEDGSTTYDVTLRTMSADNLCNAITITSPVNPYEKFVIEVREKSNAATTDDSYDGGIPASGVIVYRVDTTVDSYSNYYDKTGVYIFSEDGSQADKSRAKAALGKTRGRTSFGSSDMNETSPQKAITFSNGANTGILVSEVGDIAGGKVNLKVTLPDWSSLDTWEAVKGIAGAKVQLFTADDKPMAAAQQTARDTTLRFYEYTADGFVASSAIPDLTDDQKFDEVKLFSTKEGLLAAYSDGYGKGHIKLLKNRAWSEADSTSVSGGLADVTEIDIEQAGNRCYAAYIVSSKTLYVSEISFDTGKASLKAPVKVKEGFFGQPRVLSLNGSPVIAYRNAGGTKAAVELAKMNSDGTSFTDLQNIEIDSYDVITYNNELYLASASTSALSISKYDAASDTWKLYSEKNTDSFSPKLTVSQGNLYVVTGPATDTSKGVYAYEITAEGLIQEGLAVEAGMRGSNYSLIAEGSTLLVGYTADSAAYVKEKTSANRLLSLTVTPPTKTSYITGETTSCEGLKVTANYQKNSRELARGEYEVSGFQADKAGDFTAVVTMVSDRTISNSFGYTVTDPAENPAVKPEPPETKPEITALTVKAPKKTVYYAGDTVSAAGMTVRAKYTDGSQKNLAAGEYMVSGFSAAKAGSYKALVALKSNTAIKASFAYTVKPLAAPALTAAVNEKGSIKVSWKKVNGASKYRVYRKTGRSAWKQIGSTAAASWNDKSGLKSGTRYSYTVRAVNGSCLSSYHKTGVSETRLSVPVLKKARNVKKGVKVAWKKVAGASKYRVYRKTAGGRWKKVKDTKKTSWINKAGLKKKKTYYYTVRAIKGADMSAYNAKGVKVKKR